MGIFYIIVMIEVVSLFIVICYILYIYYWNFGIVVVFVFRWVNVYIFDKFGKFLGVKKFVIEDNYDLLVEVDFKRIFLMKKDLDKRFGSINNYVKIKLLYDMCL